MPRSRSPRPRVRSNTKMRSVTLPKIEEVELGEGPPAFRVSGHGISAWHANKGAAVRAWRRLCKQYGRPAKERAS